MPAPLKIAQPLTEFERLRFSGPQLFSLRVVAAITAPHLIGAPAGDPAAVFPVDIEKTLDSGDRCTQTVELLLVVGEALEKLGELTDQIVLNRRQALAEQIGEFARVELLRQLRST